MLIFLLILVDILSISNAISILKGTDNVLLIERIADLKDLRKQLLQFLLGKDRHNQCHDPATILYSDEFTLSDVLNLDDNVIGITNHQISVSSEMLIINLFLEQLTLYAFHTTHSFGLQFSLIKVLVHIHIHIHVLKH